LNLVKDENGDLLADSQNTMMLGKQKSLKAAPLVPEPVCFEL
jgi:hypothetical protein